MIEGGLHGGVIVAENDPLIRGVIRSVLVDTRKHVFLAVDGLEAVSLASQFKAELVLLDIAMPRLNGLEACKRIRALPGYAGVAIVMLTGHDDERLRQAAKRFGANDFITKPFRPDMLLTRLAIHLDVPEQALLRGTAGGSGDSAPRLGHAQIWNHAERPSPPAGDHPQLNSGRAAIRIYRDAERRSLD
jgi:DNA-binding response OmpR family regulator